MRWMADVYDARREHCGDESVQRLAGTGASRTQHRYPAFDRGGWGILTCGSAQVSQPPGPAPGQGSEERSRHGYLIGRSFFFVALRTVVWKNPSPSSHRWYSAPGRLYVDTYLRFPSPSCALHHSAGHSDRWGDWRHAIDARYRTLRTRPATL